MAASPKKPVSDYNRVAISYGDVSSFNGKTIAVRFDTIVKLAIALIIATGLAFLELKYSAVSSAIVFTAAHPYLVGIAISLLLGSALYVSLRRGHPTVSSGSNASNSPPDTLLSSCLSQDYSQTVNNQDVESARSAHIAAQQKFKKAQTGYINYLMTTTSEDKSVTQQLYQAQQTAEKELHSAADTLRKTEQHHRLHLQNTSNFY